MAKKEQKTKKERFLEMVDELFEDDDDDGPSGREETTIVLRGKDALAFLGIGEKEAGGDEGDDEKKKKDPDETPKRGGGYFKSKDGGE